MRAGQLRHRVQVQSRSSTTSGGELSDTWSTVATVWADIDPLTGRELLAAHQTQSEATIRVAMRYGSELKDLTSDDRLLFKGRVLEIIEAKNASERNEEWHLLCKENPALLKPPSLLTAQVDVGAEALILTFDQPIASGVSMSGIGYTKLWFGGIDWSVQNNGFSPYSNSNFKVGYALTNVGASAGGLISWDGSGSNPRGQNGLMVLAYTDFPVTAA
ncbi:MAG: phage head closure protein [Methyloligellaceae bacterium]